jgi:TonB family protein
MTKSNDPHDADFRATLPADLQSLDIELSAIRIEERPSFAPELKGELANAWKEGAATGKVRSRPWVRLLLAAGFAGLMVAGVSVPAARAAVIELVQTVAKEVSEIFSPVPEVTPEVALPPAQVPAPEPEPEPAAPAPQSDVVVSAVDATAQVETTEEGFPTLPRVDITFPRIASRLEAARIIASHYPKELQRQGVEGSVNLYFWVDAQGNVENIQTREGGSGIPELNRAAMLAVREIRFEPATRNGVGVGTWVQVDVRFVALTGAGILGLDSMDSGG